MSQTYAVASSTLVPSPRGPVTVALIDVLTGAESDLERLEDLAEAAVATTGDVVTDDDLQLALLLLYSLHYGPARYVQGDWEWNPRLIAVRTVIEREFERELRAQVPMPAEIPSTAESMAGLLFELTGDTSGPSLSKWFSKNATDEQLREFMVQRSIYTLKEADAHSWTIPRLQGRAKVALVEIQSDEYGAGRPDRMHATIFAGAMRALGLDPEYAHYIDQVPGLTLASFNMMTMFGLHRRLRGASVGHLAAFEMTSSIPCRLYGNGFRRLGYGPDVTWYFDEHVEADAVHEQIAGRDLAGGLAEDEPDLAADIVFGAAACLHVDGRVGDYLLDRWQRGETSLRQA